MSAQRFYDLFTVHTYSYTRILSLPPAVHACRRRSLETMLSVGRRVRVSLGGGGSIAQVSG
jgi:hypothetical protein